jgi:hypothetical protein
VEPLPVPPVVPGALVPGPPVVVPVPELPDAAPPMLPDDVLPGIEELLPELLGLVLDELP